MADMIRNWRKGVASNARSYHGRTPGVRRLPIPAIAIILAVALVNALAWVAAGIISVWLMEMSRHAFL